MANLGTGYSAS